MCLEMCLDMCMEKPNGCSTACHALGDNCTSHDYMAHDYMGHNYMGQNYMGQNYMGQNFMGQNYNPKGVNQHTMHYEQACQRGSRHFRRRGCLGGAVYGPCLTTCLVTRLNACSNICLHTCMSKRPQAAKSFHRRRSIALDKQDIKEAINDTLSQAGHNYLGHNYIGHDYITRHQRSHR